MELLQNNSEASVGAIVLIDGECHLCQHITRYLIGHDKKRAFSFATLQSVAGQRLLRQGGLDTENWNSFVLYDNGRFYMNSGAALRVLRGLGGWRSMLYAFIAVPAPLRDAVYRWIAKNRHRFGGTAPSCLMPTPEVMSRFVKDGIASVSAS
ncbi:thiol-disulfide oxidoreductase DCC family protein [Paenibacillus sp. NPDC057967]|uniref:thiol-disulfide oxidoreductase DCC family protein n=1 Tax=Paenibacillus sp. NPDC057967 TaxID=3346293 RepID=UPI0036DDC49B